MAQVLKASKTPGKALATALVTSRVQATAAALGLKPPPAPLRLRFLPFRGRWTLIIQSPKLRLPAIAEWLEGYGAKEIRVVSNQSGELIYAYFDGLPPAWKRWAERFRIVEIALQPGGTAVLTLEGALKDLQGFVARYGGVFPKDHRPAESPSARRDDLTPHQFLVLTRALEAGYYKVPRRADLRAIAKELGVSASALSETLRRAEERVVSSYLAIAAPASNGKRRVATGG